jgi:hypothetical protein
LDVSYLCVAVAALHSVADTFSHSNGAEHQGRIVMGEPDVRL